MQTDATASHSAIAEENLLRSALLSLNYPDLVDRHVQNHVMAGFPLPPSLEASPYLYEPSKTVVDSTFECSYYSYHALPFDASTRWNDSHPELHQGPMMNEWILTDQDRFNSVNPGPSRLNKELSLSLASSHPCVVHGASIPEQGSEMSSSGVTSYPLNKRHVGSDNTSCSSNNISLNFSSSKPSRFFQAMQEILAEFAGYALENLDHTSVTFTPINGLDSEHGLVLHSSGKDAESKRKHLLSLLQMVDDQYSQCLDEIHTIVSAFHVVTELDPNLHARFALPAISLMYRKLRERISSHILAMGALHSQVDATEDSSLDTSFIQKQWALQQLKKRDHQLWRPQRGLPERSVSVLRAWMFQNFLHPYPKDAEKHLLALKSGLTRSQVSNWFINARVRLWKPMIEEMYAEMNRRKVRRNEEDTNGSHRSHLSRRFTVD